MKNSTSTTKPLILIDGSSYLHRAYHALPQLATSRGEPTGAIYGVISMVRKLIKDYDPEYIAVMFDAKGKNFRHELYPEYKAKRPQMDDELRLQTKPVHEIIRAMGLPLLIIDGVEADDVIATLARRAACAGMNVLVSTGDKDLAQLVNDQITLINTMNNLILDVKGVQEKFGVPPEKIIDYLALIGDSSDNIPGVAGIGPKTAVKLLQEYGGIDQLMQNAHEVKGKVGDNLRQSLALLPMIRKLLTVKDDVELDCKVQDLMRKPQNSEKLIELFKHFEFKSWLTTLVNKSDEPARHNHQTVAPNYQVILTEKALQEYLQQIHRAEYFVFEVHTNSLNITDATIVGISLALEIGKSEMAAYIPVAHDYADAPMQLKLDYVLQQIQPFLADTTKIKLGHNLKFDTSVLANYGVTIQGPTFDTMLESYVLNSASNHHDKETLSFKYLGETSSELKDLAEKSIKQALFNQVDLEQAALYAVTSSAIVLCLHKILWEELIKIPSLVKVLQEIDMPMVKVLSQMERYGVKINAQLLHEQSKEIAVKLEKIGSDAYKIAGTEFNLNSPQQLQEILFNKLQLPVLQKTPKGQPSTAENVLQELALEYELPKLILEYRSLNKLKSTYTDTLPAQINAKSGRVHTSYNQAITATGRLSSTEPNLQNIPIRTEEGRRIRQAFIAEKGYKMVSADYSQIELRIMAHLSRDEGLLDAFAINGDIHRATAAEVFGVALEDVTPLQRQRAKTINFGLIYGMSAFGLAKRLGLSRAAAQGYVDIYFKHYPGVKAYMEEMRVKAQQLGYVETIFGRRLYIPDIKARNFQLRAAAERAAINAPMQGSAADMMKITMIKIDKWIEKERLRKSGLDIKMIMQVHDELIFEIATADVEKAIPEIKNYMENTVPLSVPVLVQVGVGDNWDEAH